ncbi:MAG: site-2 protease family protein, partial [Candidatus Diapherotrites archaeon]|nr:site-2 protease family protein [Candidatus Diapherotrites archaeon]
MLLLQWIVLFLGISLIATFLFRKYLGAQTWLLVSMIRTRKPLAFFEKAARFKTIFSWMARAGLFLGFGALAVDFWAGQKLSPPRRILQFILSAILLSAVFIGIDAALNGFISRSPFSKDSFFLLAAVFGLFGFAGISIASLLFQAIAILQAYLSGQPACPGVAPLIPGVELPNVPITPPLLAWIPLFLILLIHETAHGILCRVHRMEVKSAGLLLLGFLPIGAFVEPEEEDVRKRTEQNPKPVLEMLAAGPASNLASLVGAFAGFFVVFLLLGTVFGGWAQDIRSQATQGIAVESVREKVTLCKKDYSSPAFGVVMPGWEVKSVNGKEVRFASEVSLALSQNDGQPVRFEFLDANQGVHSVELKPNELGNLGLALNEIPVPGFTPPPEYGWLRMISGGLLEFFNLLFLLSLLIAIVNFLPF